MCGIVGELNYKKQAELHSTSQSFQAIEKANNRQRHRGPDEEGLYQIGNLILGHRRLKVFDLSNKGAQPLVDYDLGLALVFNGAIYNFFELRLELKSKGYQFVSHSDTEVLLKAYHAWGIDCIPRLQGMFAFAIWERETGRLVLARDRLGIKPLYYSETPDSFRFASTLPALLEFENVDTSIDPQALHYYFTFHAVPEPLTILNGIKKLPAGCIMLISPDGRREQRRYWQMHFNHEKTHFNKNEENWLQTTHEVLNKAIQKQFKADVPIGILLSGGLDSSLLTAMASTLTKEPIQTFSIGFESSSELEGNEFNYSDIIAKHFKTTHHRLSISNKELINGLDKCILAMSEPMPSHDNIAFYLLASKVAEHVKVVLSGQGADELFAGYHWISNFHNMTVSEPNTDYYRKQISDWDYESYCMLISPDWRTSDLSRLFIQNAFKENGSSCLAESALQIDASFALSNGPLSRVDNMTMASSLEARVPFLDEIVLDLAIQMPLHYKLPEGGKFILKQLGRKLLPKTVVDRPKGYFPVPIIQYLQSPILDLMKEVLSPKRIQERGIFNASVINALLDQPHIHSTPLGASKLWQVGLLEYWLQQQGL